MQNSLGNINDLIDYFNLNKHIFEKQKNNKQHMQRIMCMLTQQNMKILQKQFQLYTKGLQLPTFIYLMKKLYIPEDQLSKYYFVSDLIKFFQAIDVNGDGHLQWSQFTQYIIQNIRRVQKPNYKNKTFQENQIISSAYSKISNQYKITKIIDTGANNSIKKIIYLRKECKYYVLQTGSNMIRIFDDKFTKIDEFSLKGQAQSSYIIDFSYDQENQIFCALFQGSARFCNIKLAGAIKFMNQVEEKKLKNYHKIEYLARHGLWSFMSKNGQVKYSKVNYKSRTQMTYLCQMNIKLHDGLITDIVEIQQPKYVLTSSMDGTIKLFSLMLKKWQTFEHISQQTHSIINNKNKKGILGIDYTREFGSYILSYGFSTKIYIYSLDISLTKGYTGKYNEHSGNLISAKFLKCYPYVLSFDDKLNLRIWDFRTFQTIQIINCQKNFINPSKLQIIPELSQCLICEKKITQFRAPSLQKKSKQINEFYNIFDFKICSMTNNIFVFTSNDVRVYNYITGSLINVFTKLDQNQFDTNITAAQFGYKSRKFFLGDAAGYVRQFDSQTGQYLQQIKPNQDIQYEHKAIVKIIFLKQHSLLVICTLDGRIMIYERDSNSEFQIIRDIRQSHQQLTCAAASVRYCLLATGSDNGTVNIWNLQKFSIQSVLVLKHKIIHIAFSPIHPIMIVVEQTGVINFFYVRPYQNSSLRYKCFLKIQNRNQNNILQQISSFSFDLIINAYFNKKCSLIQNMLPAKHHFILAIGHKNGDILVVNINQIVQRFKIQQNHQIFSTKKSIRCQIQNAKTLISNQRNKILSIQGYSNDQGEVININEFKNRRRFNGHNQKIDQLLLIKQNSIILTTSSIDKKLKVYNLQGDMNGSIDFYTFKKINWKISQINFHKKLQAIQTCIYAIKLIENRKFTNKEQQEIKINLLMNEFMDQKQKLDYIKWIKVVKRNRYPQIRSRPVTRTKNNINSNTINSNNNINMKQTKQHKQKQHNKQNIDNSNKQIKQRQKMVRSQYQYDKSYNNQKYHSSDNKHYHSQSQEDQQMLEQYFRNIRLNQTVTNGKQQSIVSQSISTTEFNQIYKKLQAKIKQKIQQSQNNNKFQPNKQFTKIDPDLFSPHNLLNQFNINQSDQILQPNKLFQQGNNKKINNFLKNESNKKTKNLVNNLINTLVIPINQDRITSPKQDLQYQKLFRKTLEPRKDKIKTNKKVNNLLYQNLTQARRKINIMTKIHSNKSSLFS